MNGAKEVITRKEALQKISKSSIYGNLGLFIGAGMSMAVLNNNWDTVALSWKELIFKCAKEFNISLKEEINLEGISYPEIASEIAKLIAKKENIDYQKAINKLKEKIASLTSWYPEKEERKIYGKILEDISPNWIITTNYDLIIECLLTGKCLSLGPSDQLISPQNLIPVYHLHGIRTNPNSIIISQEDYISLFRPNQYRQQKLSLSIKESTTLIVGYSLGDVNVLTAVDWTKNVYSNQRINYPHDIIQLLYTKNPLKEPYRDKNEILIIEFDDLKSILVEITATIEKDKKVFESNEKKLHNLNNIFENPDEHHITQFVDDENFRKDIVKAISKNDVKLISGFLELFSRAIELTWIRSEPKNAFFAYDENLSILLDIIIDIELNKIPPALLESIAYNFNRVSFYIGNHFGESQAAYKTWCKRKNAIPENTILELINIAKARQYYNLKKLLNN